MIIGFIGLGNMASAMVRGIAAAQLEGVALCGHNPHPEKAKALAESCGLRLCASNREVLERSDVVVLAVKPQILEGVLEEIAPLAAGKLFLSVAAGKELAWLSARLGHGCIVRAMPNINAVVGASVTGWCAGEQVTEEQKALAARLLGTFGTAVEVPEKFMGIVGAIGGAAPAYTYLYINALAEAAVRAGMPKGMAVEIAAAMAEGSGRMVRLSGQQPWVLIDRVTSTVVPPGHIPRRYHGGGSAGAPAGRLRARGPRGGAGCAGQGQAHVKKCPAASFSLAAGHTVKKAKEARPCVRRRHIRQRIFTSGGTWTMSAPTARAWSSCPGTGPCPCGTARRWRPTTP